MGGIIDQILEDDRTQPRKQRHTSKRIWERLSSEHAFSGGYTIVKDYVREARVRYVSGGEHRVVPGRPQPAVFGANPATEDQVDSIDHVPPMTISMNTVLPEGPRS